MLIAYCQNSIQLTSASPFFCSVARVCTLTAVGVACPCSRLILTISLKGRAAFYRKSWGISWRANRR